MAKKNSTKTATKEALQASEPRLQVFTGWQGINIEQAPYGWNYQTTGEQTSYQNNPIGQTDLQPNFLTIQNNVDTAPNGTLETRNRETALYSNEEAGLTGVVYLKNDTLYAVYNSGKGILRKNINDGDAVKVGVPEPPNNGKWTDIYSYTNNGVDTLICLCSYTGMDDEQAQCMYTCPLKADGTPDGTPTATAYIPDPSGQHLRIEDVGFTLANNKKYSYDAAEYVWLNQICSSQSMWESCTQETYIFNFTTDVSPLKAGDSWMWGNCVEQIDDYQLTDYDYAAVDITDYAVDANFTRTYNSKKKEYSDWKYAGTTYSTSGKTEYWQDICDGAGTNYIRIKNSKPTIRYKTTGPNGETLMRSFPKSYTPATLNSAIGDGNMNVNDVVAVSKNSMEFLLTPYREFYTSANYGGYIAGNILDSTDRLTMVAQCVEKIGTQKPRHYYTEKLTSAVFGSGSSEITDDAKLKKTVYWQCQSGKFKSTRCECPGMVDTADHATSLWFLDSRGHFFCFSYEIDAMYPSWNYGTKNPHVNGCGCLHMYVLTPPETLTGGKDSSLYYNAGSTTQAATFYYTLTNKHGGTLLSEPYEQYNTVNMNLVPDNYTETRHVSFNLAKSMLDSYKEVTGVNFYSISGEGTEPILAKSATIEDMKTHTVTLDGTEYYCLDYYGSLENTDTWFLSGLTQPEFNTTAGVHAGRVTAIDSRLYFWHNVDKPYQLTIGGRSKLELYYDISYGGGYVQADPGTGVVIHHVCKFKTASGANIVTLLCGNQNTTQTKRYNLIEDSITLTSELETTGWSVEHVSNVVGCNSDYGAVVCADGIYVLDPLGLMVTTQQMEYSNQLQSRSVSDAIKPVFVDKKAASIIATECASMVYLDNKLYFHLGHENTTEENLLYIYDLGTKAFWTYTLAATPLRLFNLDSVNKKNALGIVTATGITYINLSGDDALVPARVVTGELTARQPTQAYTHVSQLEFRFDYIKTSAEGLTITVRGVDVYGRRVEVTKTLVYKDMAYDTVDWMRLDYKLENFHVTFSGTACYRMTHFLGRVFVTSSKINEQYGYDSISQYYRRGSSEQLDGHDHGGLDWIVKNYNNFKECVIA